jgi:hypothetical protein
MKIKNKRDDRMVGSTGEAGARDAGEGGEGRRRETRSADPGHQWNNLGETSRQQEAYDSHLQNNEMKQTQSTSKKANERR